MIFKKIPISKDFFINEDGVVLNKNGNKKNFYMNLDGYKTVSIKNSSDKWQTYGVHYLLALTFIDNPNPDFNQVNHIDGNKINNSLNNLEWVSAYLNNIHSELFSRDKKFNKLAIYKNGIIFKIVRNIYDAEKIVGFDRKTIWQSLKNNLPINGFSFGYLKNSSRKLLIKEKSYNNSFKPREIKTLNLNTFEIKHYKSMKILAKELSCGINLIRRALLVNDEIKALKKMFLVCDADVDFPDLTEKQITTLLTRGKKQVIAYSYDIKKIFIFESASSFIKETNLSKKSVSTILIKNSFRKISNWIFCYETKQNISKMSSLIKCLE